MGEHRLALAEMLRRPGRAPGRHVLAIGDVIAVRTEIAVILRAAFKSCGLPRADVLDQVLGREAQSFGLARPVPSKRACEGIGDHCADAGRPRQSQAGHEALGGGDEAPLRPAHGRAEGGGQDRPLHQGPRGRRAGLCRNGQDHDAEAAPFARREAGLPCDRACAFDIGGGAPWRAKRASRARPFNASSPVMPALRRAGERTRACAICLFAGFLRMRLKFLRYNSYLRATKMALDRSSKISTLMQHR